MDAAKTVQDVSALAVAEERDPSRDVPAGPVTADRGGWRHRLAVDSKWMQSAIAVEYVAACAAGQKCEVSRDVPARPVGACLDRGGGSERVEPSVPVEHGARLKGPGNHVRRASDLRAGPVRGAGEWRAVVGMKAPVPDQGNKTLQPVCPGR